MKNLKVNWVQVLLDVIKIVAGAVFGSQVL